MKLKATLVLVVALVGGAGVFIWRAVRPNAQSTVREPELRWLKREFALDDETMRRIAELHQRYVATCEPKCSELQASDTEISRLMARGSAMTPELAVALRHSNEIIADCQQRMVQHFYAVAKEMPPAAGERYLALMTPVAIHPEQGWMKVAP